MLTYWIQIHLNGYLLTYSLNIAGAYYKANTETKIKFENVEEQYTKIKQTQQN